MKAGLGTLVLLAAGALGAGPAAAAEATPTPATPSHFSLTAASSHDVVSTYPMPRTLPTGGAGPLVVDHSGNVWFSETIEEPPETPGGSPRHPNQIARMNRAGQVALVTKGAPGDLAVGPDNSIWFTGFRAVVRIAPDGNVDSFKLAEVEDPVSGAAFRTTVESAIVVGQEGDAWFAATRHPLDEEGREAGSIPLIARMTPTGELSEYVLPERGSNQIRLALGPEGNIWFTASAVNRVGYITPQGRIEEFPAMAQYSSPNFITAGPDGAVWFSMEEKGPLIARSTTSWAPAGFRIGGEKENVGAGPLVAGPDGRIWFGAEAGVIGRLDPATGRLSKVTLPNHTYAQDLAVGPEGEVWYSSDAEPPCLTGDTACGDAGYYTSGIIGRIAPAPLSIELVSAKPARAGRQVKVRINCLDGAASSVCGGTLRVRAAGTKGGRGYALGADGAHTFAVTLPKTARAKLLRNRRLAVRVEATLGGGAPVSRRFPLRIPARKQGR